MSHDHTYHPSIHHKAQADFKRRVRFDSNVSHSFTLGVLRIACVSFGTTLFLANQRRFKLLPSPPRKFFRETESDKTFQPPRLGLTSSHVNQGPLHPVCPSLNPIFSTLAQGQDLHSCKPSITIMSSSQQIGDHSQRSGIAQRFSSDDTMSDSGYGSVSDGSVGQNAPVQIFPGSVEACELSPLRPNDIKRMTNYVPLQRIPNAGNGRAMFINFISECAPAIGFSSRTGVLIIFWESSNQNRVALGRSINNTIDLLKVFFGDVGIAKVLLTISYRNSKKRMLAGQPTTHRSQRPSQLHFNELSLPLPMTSREMLTGQHLSDELQPP